MVVIFLLGVLGEAELIGDMNFLPPGKLGTGTPEGLHSELNLFLLGKGMSTKVTETQQTSINTNALNHIEFIRSH